MADAPNNNQYDPGTKLNPLYTSGVPSAGYQAVAASQTAAPLGDDGAVGDFLSGVLVIPASTSPGAVSIKDGTDTAITLFAGGALSVTTLSPFFVPFGARSADGGWSVTTGANVSVVAIGNFS